MSIADTLRALIEQNGLGLLGDPRRLDAFLRDLVPERPQEVFLLVEVAESGVLARLRCGLPGIDAEQRGCAEQLAAVSGVAPNLSLWAVQVWSDALPEAAWLEDQAMPQEERQSDGQRWEGSIEEVLGAGMKAEGPSLC
jgi:hypothetical protein